LAELRWTAYGSFKVYYTGNDARYKSLPVDRYYFFSHKRGHVSDAQIAAGHDVWDSTTSADWSTPFPLKQYTVYHLRVDADEQANWSLDLVDDNSGEVLEHVAPREDNLGETEAIFRTSVGDRVRFDLRSRGQRKVDSGTISRIRIREITIE